MPMIRLQRHYGVVAPAPPPMTRPANEARAAVTASQFMGAVVNWLLCLLLMFLLLSQFLTIVLRTSVHPTEVSYGQDPRLGPFAIAGLNDEPYSDRVLVCRRRGRRFDVISVNEALSDPVNVIVEDSSGANVNGYYVVKRTSMTVSDDTRRMHVNTCSRINATLDRILSICHDLGYMNVTRDALRVLDDVYSSTTSRIPKALPVLIMPFWDNAPTARYVIPGWDGHACMFRLGGTFEVQGAPNSYLIAVNRTVRESKTVEWLGRPGGSWRNGWYQDAQGMRWYSDILSSDPLNADRLTARQFDMVGMREMDCLRNKSGCALSGIESQWGDLSSVTNIFSFVSVAVSNGTHFGLFSVEATGSDVVTCLYSFVSLSSDISLAWLLFQWMLSMIAVQRGVFKRVSAWQITDIGCLANSYSFGVLSITTLPRLKMLIAAFCTVGCEFQGSQRALSSAWFVIYPAIVNLVLLHSSVVNVLARIFRRRLISWNIPVTILFLSLIHYLRAQICAYKWFGLDGRPPTLVSSEQFDAMSLFDLLTPSTVLRLTGDFKAMCLLKLCVISFNTLPLVFSEDMSATSKRSLAHVSCSSEQSLCVRACNIGGLGRSGLYEWGNSRQMLNSYELVRMGYIVVGDTYLMTWESWIQLVVISALNRLRPWRNHRLLVFEVTRNDDQSSSISSHPLLVNASDPKLLGLRLWDIDSRALV